MNDFKTEVCNIVSNRQVVIKNEEKRKVEIKKAECKNIINFWANNMRRYLKYTAQDKGITTDGIVRGAACLAFRGIASYELLAEPHIVTVSYSNYSADLSDPSVNIFIQSKNYATSHENEKLQIFSITAAEKRALLRGCSLDIQGQLLIDGDSLFETLRNELKKDEIQADFYLAYRITDKSSHGFFTGAICADETNFDISNKEIRKITDISSDLNTSLKVPNECRDNFTNGYILSIGIITDIYIKL